MNYKVLYKNKVLAEIKVEALKITWSHARRKRREKARQEKLNNVTQMLITRLKTFAQADHLIDSAKMDEMEIEVMKICNELANFKQFNEIEDENVRTTFMAAKTEFLTKINMFEQFFSNGLKEQVNVLKLGGGNKRDLDDGDVEPSKQFKLCNGNRSRILIEFVIFITCVSKNNIKVNFFKNRNVKDDSNLLCEIYNYFINRINKTDT